MTQDIGYGPLHDPRKEAEDWLANIWNKIKSFDIALESERKSTAIDGAMAYAFQSPASIRAIKERLGIPKEIPDYLLKSQLLQRLYDVYSGESEDEFISELLSAGATYEAQALISPDEPSYVPESGASGEILLRNAPPSSNAKTTDVGSGQTDVGSGQTGTGTGGTAPSVTTPMPTGKTQGQNRSLFNLDQFQRDRPYPIPTQTKIIEEEYRGGPLARAFDLREYGRKPDPYGLMMEAGIGSQGDPYGLDPRGHADWGTQPVETGVPPVETGVPDDGSWYSGITDWVKGNPGWALQGLGALLALAGNDPRQKLEDARMASGRELIGKIPEYTPQEMSLADPYPIYAANGAIAMQEGGVANPDSSEKSILGKFLDLFLMPRPEKTMEEVVPGMTGKPYGAQNKTLQEYKDLYLINPLDRLFNRNHDAHVERWEQWKNIENQMREEARESRKQDVKRTLMDMLDQHIEGGAKPFAHGGVAGQAYMGGPTQGLVGEAGPEWVGPLNQSPVKGTALADLLNIPTRRFANGGVAGDLTKSNYDPNQNIGMPDLTPRTISPPVTPAPVQNQTPYWQGIHEGIRETQQGLGRGTPSDVSFQRAVAPYYMQQHQADRQFGLQDRQLGQMDMNNAWQRIMDQNRFNEMQRQFATTSGMQGAALSANLTIPQYSRADFMTSIGQGVAGLGRGYNAYDYLQNQGNPYRIN